MPRTQRIHRNNALRQLGWDPEEHPLETLEHRRGQAAIDMVKWYAKEGIDLIRYPVPGKRALRYDQAQVDRLSAKIQALEKAA